MCNAATRHVKDILHTAETHRLLLPERLDRETQERSEAKRRQFRERLMTWVHAHDDVGARIAAGSLAKRINYVTLQEFYAAFDLHMDWLNSQLRMPYYLVTKTLGSSMELPSSPSTWLGYRVLRRMRPPMRGMIIWSKQRLWEREGAWPENIVFADGCAYSGEAIADFMLSLALLLMHKVKVKGLQGRRLPDVNVWFLMPFRTAEAQRTLAGVHEVLRERVARALSSNASSSSGAYETSVGLAEWEAVQPRIKAHFCPAYETIPSVREAETELRIQRLGSGGGLIMFEHQELETPDTPFPHDLIRGCLLTARTDNPGTYALGGTACCPLAPMSPLNPRASVPETLVSLDDFALDKLRKIKSHRISSRNLAFSSGITADHPS